MSFTPFNAPLLSGLLGDTEIASEFVIKADITAMLQFEAALARVQERANLIPEGHGDEISRVCQGFEPDMAALQSGVLRDGMAVPELVAQLRKACGNDVAPYVHFGSTSQDVIDSSLSIRLKSVNTILSARLNQLNKELQALDEKFGANQIIGKTRMQSALPVLVSHRLDQWRKPIENLATEFVETSKNASALQLGGPVGDLSKFAEKAEETRAGIAKELGLLNPGTSWQTDRSRLVNYSHWLCRLAIHLGKVSTDFLLMVQNEVSQIEFEGAGGSSAMAHKQNPVRAEVLLTQSRFIIDLHGSLTRFSIHEQERSGTGWTGEWLVLPQLCVLAGSSVSNAIGLLQSITLIGTRRGD